MRFAVKLIVLILFIILSIIFAISYFTHTSNTKILESEIIRNLENDTYTTTDIIDRVLFERYSDIKVMVSGAIIGSRSSTPRQITERMIQYRNQYKSYVSLSFFDLNGVRIADTEGLSIGKKLNPAKYWEEVMKNGISAASDISIDDELKIPVIYFASQVNDKDGIPFGVIVARMPVTKLYEITEKSNLNENDRLKPSIDLISEDGLLIYSNYNKKGVLKENLFKNDNIVKKWQKVVWEIFQASRQREANSFIFFQEKKATLILRAITGP